VITLSPELLRAIEAVVGAEHVSTRETDRLVYSVDAYWMPQLRLDRGGKPAQAAAIVSPGSVDEIAQLLAIANQARVPVVPWGGGSGTQGGALPIHGGLIVGPLVGAWLAAKWKLPVLRGFDVAAPSLAIGQAIGRWGNFFNEEAFGAPTNLPWKLYISPEHRPPGFARFDYFHPTFLYESLWDLGIFIVLIAWLRPRLRQQPGALFFSYIGLYSVGRFIIEAVRLDSFWIGPFRVAQLASLLGVAIAIAGLAWTKSRGASTAPLETPP